MNKIFKNNFLIQTQKLDYNDLENLYQRGLKIYKTLSKNQLEQQKVTIEHLILMNQDYSTSLWNVIHKNETIMNDIEILLNNNDCRECGNSDINGLSDGPLVICLILLILEYAFVPFMLIGTILFVITGGILGKLLMIPCMLIGGIGVELGCWESPFP